MVEEGKCYGEKLSWTVKEWQKLVSGKFDFCED